MSDFKAVVKDIEKQFGKGSIISLGDKGAFPDIEGISTGSLSLDLALGGVGIPRGRISEIYGPESSGKTTIALHAIASAQKLGGRAMLIDAEHAFDPGWARKLGVAIDDMLCVCQPTTGEEALQIVEKLIPCPEVSIIVIDSVAALVPRAELDGEIGDSHVGLQARLMSQAMRKFTGAISKSKAAVLFINQIREKIGVMFGSPETTPGGRALKFYSSCRMDVRRIGQIKDGEAIIGQRVRVKVVKNKIAPPFREAEFDMLHKSGISYEGDVIDISLDRGILTRRGAWIDHNGESLGQGRDRARDFLIEHPEVTKAIVAKMEARHDRA